MTSVTPRPRPSIHPATRIAVALLVFALGLAATALFVALVVNPLVRPARDTGMHRDHKVLRWHWMCDRGE